MINSEPIHGAFGAARIKRTSDLLLARIERTKPRFGVANPGFDGSNLRGDIDQLGIELAAILTDRCDLGLELLLKFGGVPLLLTGSVEFLLTLLDGLW